MTTARKHTTAEQLPLAANTDAEGVSAVRERDWGGISHHLAVI